MASHNHDLHTANKAKKAEFYTQLTDIEKEMRYYRKHFKDKTVLCNCDDPFESNFFKYFVSVNFFFHFYFSLMIKRERVNPFSFKETLYLYSSKLIRFCKVINEISH